MSEFADRLASSDDSRSVSAVFGQVRENPSQLAHIIKIVSDTLWWPLDDLALLEYFSKLEI